MNTYNFHGRLGQDAKVHTTERGDRVINFSVAVDRSYYNKQSKEMQRLTEWINCEYWNQSELNKHLITGSVVVVEGIPYAQEYKGKAYLKVKVTKVNLLHKPNTSNESPGGDYIPSA